MEWTELQPGDVLFFDATNWLWKLFVKKRHVAIYFDQTKRGLPLIIESIGRGVLIRSLFSYNEEITVKRTTPEVDATRYGAPVGELAAKYAERLADNPGSWYGYYDIARFVLPKLFVIKLGRWLPKTWKITLWLLAKTYRRNNVYICSELVQSAYRSAGCPLVDDQTIPLPDDLFASPKLVMVGTVTPTPPNGLNNVKRRLPQNLKELGTSIPASLRRTEE